MIRAAALALLLGIAGQAQAQHLRIVSEAWAPYAYLDNGVARGLDYEAANAVFQRLGVDVEWQFLPWKRCLSMLENGQADGILDAYRTPERVATLLFPAEPMSRSSAVMYYAKGQPHPFTELETLRGLTVGTLPGWLYYDGFNESTLFTREPGPTQEANIGKLLLGRIDLMITDRRAGRYVIDQMGVGAQLIQNPLVLGTGDLFLALHPGPGMASLMERFSLELKHFKSEPAYQQLSDQYPDG